MSKLREACSKRFTVRGSDLTVPLAVVTGLVVSIFVWSRSSREHGFPSTLSEWIDFAGAVNLAEDWLQENIRGFTRAISNGMGYCLELLESYLWFAPWPAVVLAFVLPALAYGGLRLGIFTLVGVLFWGMMGMWDPAMSTLALMGVSVAFSVVIGVFVGVLCSRSDRVEAIVRPILDTMQTMPAFVYLIPAIFFFGIGGPSATVAIVIYAIPPVIRLTNLGIRQVSPFVIETAESFGTTSRQKLWKVQFPQALPSIMLGINQTIMMALGLTVLATFIGAGGLGEEVWKALRKLKVGWSLEGGLCIVFMAIIFDRLSYAMSQRTERQDHRETGQLAFRLFPKSWNKVGVAVWLETRIDALWHAVSNLCTTVADTLAKGVRRIGRIGAAESAEAFANWLARRKGFTTGTLLILAILIWDAWIMEVGSFPRSWEFTIRGPADAAVEWLAVNPTFIAFTTGMRAFIYLYILNPLDKFLVGLPWWYVLIAFFLLVWPSVGLSFAAVTVCAFLFTGMAGLWGLTMYTLASTIASVAVCFVIGLPIGIMAAHYRGMDNFIRPILDAMQTMPAFVYLIPVLMFFGGNPVTAIIATVIYALPPMIRMTILGLKQIPNDTLEVANSFGATGFQTLIKLKLPMASPSIMLGVNQAVVMALAMQVITPLVAGLGLGKEVFNAMNVADTGQGLMAGIGIVLLAIVLDRLTQGWTRKQREALGL